jgi:hypothetical protein
MYVHSDDIFVNLSAYVCDYSWAHIRCMHSILLFNWSVTQWMQHENIWGAYNNHVTLNLGPDRET